ncbi:hypothetical protein N782_00920 [Pontibacillus yanchengensis Y32]|uniref:Uncharacterized protein n=1 Tax=Pontibacillus yanchengensis Y32 TaxID=1385514 RepID=A0A0A2TFT3_9BACI|nr:hypothetical protein N782_00920 [Pontibacillus yanchengensis Y32]
MHNGSEPMHIGGRLTHIGGRYADTGSEPTHIGRRLTHIGERIHAYRVATHTYPPETARLYNDSHQIHKIGGRSWLVMKRL